MTRPSPQSLTANSGPNSISVSFYTSFGSVCFFPLAPPHPGLAPATRVSESLNEYMEEGRLAWEFLSGSIVVESMRSGVNPSGVLIGLFIHISVLLIPGTW